MHVFAHHAFLAAAPSKVFAAFAAPERLARWWGPAGFRNTFAVCEFRPGGAWRFTMHGPDGKDYPNESQFVEVVPNARVVIRHVNAPHFVLTVELHAEGQGTRVQWTQVFDDPAVAQAVRHIVEPANEQNLQRLAAEVAHTAG
ncbi:SRPBCC family protein [Curvibacter sp. APW13]|uniref:SRPBCC family protein n=1 Tax=Curvibacter sp. APW13 TaxID=3077236 RepID=UPI0028DD48D4|nr:SRPBCC family protein [Curvibacter sp. APW13]MDT8991934.1 SRPBCC family protein [Curvibacter sp. APW13]